MSAVCPQGHTSQSEDYCDICGAPISSGGGAPPAAPAPPASDPGAAEGPVACPNCGFQAAPKALFCENCGYDFTTGTPPQPVASTPADPLSLPDPSADPSSDPAPPDPGVTPPGDPATDPGEDPATDPDPATNRNEEGLPTPPVPGPDSWVVEVWVDPDWYAAQDPEDPMPSPGSPAVIPLRDRSVLVGRPSASRGIRPQVDAGSDTGVSRRHCQLTTDGVRWWVEDLDSSNGTYVSPAGEPLPSTPLDVGNRHELADGERIYIGGWTRMVVRTALPGEV